MSEVSQKELEKIFYELKDKIFNNKFLKIFFGIITIIVIILILIIVYFSTKNIINTLLTGLGISGGIAGLFGKKKVKVISKTVTKKETTSTDTNKIKKTTEEAKEHFKKTR